MRIMERLKLFPKLIRAVSVAVFFICREIFGRDADPLFMTYPSAIGKAFLEILASGELAKAFLASMIPFAIGLAISILGGILIGILIAQFWQLEYILDPFLNALYAIPRVALIPLVILWAGPEEMGKVSILVSIAIFPLIINTYSGIRDVRGSPLEIGRAYCARRCRCSGRAPFRHPYPTSWRYQARTGPGNHRNCRGRVIHGHDRVGRSDSLLCECVCHRQAVRSDHRDRSGGCRSYRDRHVR